MLGKHVKYFNIDIRKNNQQYVDMKIVSMRIIKYLHIEEGQHISNIHSIAFKTLFRRTINDLNIKIDFQLCNMSSLEYLTFYYS